MINKMKNLELFQKKNFQISISFSFYERYSGIYLNHRPQHSDEDVDKIIPQSIYSPEIRIFY